MGLPADAPSSASPPGALPNGDAAGARVVAWHVSAAHSGWVSRVWSLAQTQAGLPAPAMSVDGVSGWALWFALASPRPRAEVQRVLRHLIEGWLADAGDFLAGPGKLREEGSAWSFTCWPDGGAAIGLAASAKSDAVWPPVPRQVGPERWSAFVAPDLVPVFAESPWLDCAPGEEGQAALLARLSPISEAEWARLVEAERAQARGTTASGPGSAAPRSDVASGIEVSSSIQVPMPASGANAASPAQPPFGDPRVFLLSVMNDQGVELALRIEAARVLLAHG